MSVAFQIMEVHNIILVVVVLFMASVCHSNSTAVQDTPATTLYIRSDNTPNTTCPGLPCETLDYYANVSHPLNNALFMFLPGEHKLTKSFSLCNVQFIQFVGNDTGRYYNNSPYSKPRILCNTNNSSAGFIFENIDNLVFKNLDILYCGQMIPKTVYNVSLPVQAAVALKEISELTMHSVTVQNSSGYGVVAEGLYGNSNILMCQFQYNYGSGRYIGGNFAILYTNCPAHYTSIQNNIIIQHSKFYHGRNYRINDSISEIAASGLLLNISCANINVLLCHVTLQFNEALSYESKGGNVYIMYDGSISNNTRITLTVRDSYITHGTASIGGGVYLKLNSNRVSSKQDCQSNSQQAAVLIDNTIFEHNYGSHWGGALYVSNFEPDDKIKQCPSAGLKVHNCTFQKNLVRTVSADVGVAIHVYHYSTGVSLSLSSLPWFKITIQGTHFLHNKLRSLRKGHSQLKGGGVLYISQLRKEVNIVNSTFQQNQVTAISMFRSNVIFRGDILLDSNTGIDGGGLVLCEDSYMLLSAYTTITIQNNTALGSGGGIYAQDQCLESNFNCFYQVHLERTQTFDSVLPTTHVIMVKNKAHFTGSQIYGGNLDHCYNSLNGHSAITSYKSIFNESLWLYNNTDLSYVTSKPRFICFCDPGEKQFYCNERVRTIEHAIFPGEYVTVSIVAVGQFNHPVPAAVRANVSKDYKFIREIDAVCTPVRFRVLSKQSTEQVVLLVSSNEGYRSKEDDYIDGTDPRYLNITYKPCLLGFIISSKGDCVCPSDIQLYAVCNITARTITTLPPAWIGFNYANTSNDGTIEGMIHYHKCPLDYCLPHGAVISTSNTYFDQDAQCQHNRGGVLCGACLPTYSLSLGTDECIQCQHSYMYLWIAVVLLTPIIGFIFILLIIACNITITDCTLSGLIFYVNAIKLGNLSVMPNQSIVFRLFVEWLNLNIGIGGICFYNGFDQYTKILLQFTIPLYLWIVAGIIIFLSSKYSRIAALVGRNAVQVLATLFLLSYTKILQAEVDVFRCAGIIYPSTNNTPITKFFWFKEGSVPCWQGKHFFLVGIGSLFGMATIIYTLVLLFVQPLQRYSHYRALKWVARIKPFIDAYTCPHLIKDKCRFWMGLLLLFRILSCLHNNSLISSPLYINIVYALLLIIAWCFGGIYKKWWLKLLNASFFLNLTVLSLTTTAHYYSTKLMSHVRRAKFEETVINTSYTISLSIALAMFLMILSYHILKRLYEIGMCSFCVTRLRNTHLWQSLSTWCRGWRERRYQRVPQQEEDEIDYDRNRELQDDFEERNENEVEGAETQDGNNSTDSDLLQTYTY